MVKRSWNFLRRHPNVIGFLILGGGVIFAIALVRAETAKEAREEDREDVARVEALIDLAGRDAVVQCRAGNEARVLVREMGVELNLAQARALVDTLTDPPPDQVLVDAYLLNSEAEARAIVDGLPQRDCAAEGREAIEAARSAYEDIEPDPTN